MHNLAVYISKWSLGSREKQMRAGQALDFMEDLIKTSVQSRGVVLTIPNFYYSNEGNCIGSLLPFQNQSHCCSCTGMELCSAVCSSSAGWACRAPIAPGILDQGWIHQQNSLSSVHIDKREDNNYK